MIVRNNVELALGVERSQIGERELEDETQRIYEVWISRQRAGKSTALRARARALCRDPSISSVWIIDRTNEWPGNFEYEFTRYADVGAYLADEDEDVPRVIIWQMGEDVEPYGEVFREAGYIGDVALVIDECYAYAPANKGFVVEHLERLILSGRHIERHDGEQARVHLVLALQYPKYMHHLMWSQAEEVYCGQISGRNSRQWVRDNFERENFDALSWVDSVERFDFLPLCEPERGLPPMPGYGKSG